MASVPSALRAAYVCLVGRTLSLIWLALQLFYDNKQVLLPWNNVDLHYKLVLFLEDDIFPQFFFSSVLSRNSC